MAASIARIRLLAVRTESWLFPLRIGFSLTCRTCQREFQSQKLSPLLEHDNGAASSLMRPNTQQWLQASAALSGNIGSAGGRGLRRILGLEFPAQMTWTRPHETDRPRTAFGGECSSDCKAWVSCAGTEVRFLGFRPLKLKSPGGAKAVRGTTPEGSVCAHYDECRRSPPCRNRRLSTIRTVGKSSHRTYGKALITFLDLNAQNGYVSSLFLFSQLQRFGSMAVVRKTRETQMDGQ